MKSRASTMDNLKMQRRHFQLIARILSNARQVKDVPKKSIELLAKRFAGELRHTNSNFSYTRFMEAVMVDDDSNDT